MFFGYVCEVNLTDLIAFRSRMNNHNFFGQISLPIRYLQIGCHSYFVKLYNYYRHIETFHCKTINLHETTNYCFKTA